MDVGALENEVYDHLFSFFRRYYSEGDFLAKRVYKPGVYAIPYEGEEVKLHWANRDQYYIKTSEYLRDYAFRLRPDDDQEADARALPPGGRRRGRARQRQGGRGQGPRLHPGGRRSFIAEENGELSIRFEYRPATLTDWPEDVREGKTKPPAQKDLIAIATKRVLAVADASLATWIAELGKPHVTASGEKADYTGWKRTCAATPLATPSTTSSIRTWAASCAGSWTSTSRTKSCTWTTWRTRLRRASSSTSPRSRSSARIAGKIIDFLAQLEDFQKKLWLKKKFVVETNYCITLDRIPEEFYPEIAANDAQREEWVRLFAIDEIKGDLTTPGYSVPLTTAFLKAHPTLGARHAASSMDLGTRG